MVEIPAPSSNSLKKPLQRTRSILIPDHLVHDDPHDLLRLDPAVRVVAVLHLSDLGPVVDLLPRRVVSRLGGRGGAEEEGGGVCIRDRRAHR